MYSCHEVGEVAFKAKKVCQEPSKLARRRVESWDDCSSDFLLGCSLTKHPELQSPRLQKENIDTLDLVKLKKTKHFYPVWKTLLKEWKTSHGLGENHISNKGLYPEYVNNAPISTREWPIKYKIGKNWTTTLPKKLCIW